MDGLGVTENHSFCFIQEINKENMDAQTTHMKCLFVYTTFNKTPEGKNLICKSFDEACQRAFGEDKGRTIVIFKEHGNDNADSKLQHIISMEVPSNEHAVLIFGTIKGGSAANVITDMVGIKGTCRTYTEKMAEFTKKRVIEVTENIARAMRVEAEVEYQLGMKPVYNDPKLCDELFPFVEEITGTGKTLLVDYPTSYGGEDFSVITSLVPGLVSLI